MNKTLLFMILLKNNCTIKCVLLGVRPKLRSTLNYEFIRPFREKLKNRTMKLKPKMDNLLKKEKKSLVISYNDNL